MRASGFQVRDPHDSDNVPVIERLLFRTLVTGSDKILLCGKGLPFLLDAKFSFGDMTDHGIHHRGTGSLRSRLNDEVTHRHGFETGNEGRALTIGTLHDAWKPHRILVARGLRSGGLHYGRRSGCQPDFPRSP